MLLLTDIIAALYFESNYCPKERRIHNVAANKPSATHLGPRAAVLSIKGLSRDARAEVGERCLPGLLEVLQNDAEVDADIGKAVLETLNILCEVDEESTAQAKELSFKHIDAVLADEKATHKLLALLADQTFYLRLAILQFLIILLQNRRQVVQGYFLNAPVGPTTVIATLDEKREIIRTGVCLFTCLRGSSSAKTRRIYFRSHCIPPRHPCRLAIRSSHIIFEFQSRLLCYNFFFHKALTSRRSLPLKVHSRSSLR